MSNIIPIFPINSYIIGKKVNGINYYLMYSNDTPEELAWKRGYWTRKKSKAFLFYDPDWKREGWPTSCASPNAEKGLHFIYSQAMNIKSEDFFDKHPALTFNLHYGMPKVCLDVAVWLGELNIKEGNLSAGGSIFVLNVQTGAPVVTRTFSIDLTQREPMVYSPAVVTRRTLRHQRKVALREAVQWGVKEGILPASTDAVQIVKE